MSSIEQVVIVGAGPCGLSAAIELKKKGIHPVLIEKGATVHSIYRYPTYMIFHSTPELLEIGDVPFTTPNEKPTRQEALQYYRTVADRYELDIRNYETVTRLEKRADPSFIVHTEDRFGRTQQIQSARVIMATGFFDVPNRLNIPGENLLKVYSYYKEAHPYAGMKVAVVGGNNSAVDAALDLQRVGAEVTLVCRQSQLSDKVKAWTRPLFDSMVTKGKIKVYYESELIEITPHSIQLKIHSESEIQEMPNDFVFTLIGYRPDRTLLESIGVHFDGMTGAPDHNCDTMETNVPGVYIAGVIVAGNQANEIFIENGRFHGQLIAEHVEALLFK